MEISSSTQEIVNHDLQTRNYFNDLADSWESKQSDESQKIEELLSRLNLEQAETILDVGCGTGVLFPLFEKLTHRKSKIVAIDFAEFMVQTAALNCNGKIKVICGDSQSLPFQNNYFDRIVAFHVFPHIKEKGVALQEFWRVMKPGGDLAIIHLRGSKELNDFHAGLGGEVAHHKLPSAGELSNILALIGYEVRNSVDESDEYFVRAGRSNIIKLAD